MKKNYIIWLGLFLISFSISAQSFKEDLAQMYSNYTGSEDFQLEVKIEIATGTKTAGRINKAAYVVKSGNKYLSGYDKTEILLTENFILMVDHQNRNLVYRNISNYEWKLLQKNVFAMNLDSIYTQCDSVKYMGKTEGKESYRIFSKNSMISQTDLWMDPTTKLLERLVYEYNIKYTNQYYRTEMFFLLKKTSDASISKLASVEKMILVKGKKIELNQEYKQYQLTVVNDEDK